MNETMTAISDLTTTSWLTAKHPPLEETLELLARRIESIDKDIRAWTSVNLTLARHDAGKLRGRTRHQLPLLGAIFGIKDNIDVAGFPSRNGSAAPEAWRSQNLEAPVVARLKDAGAIVLGKTEMTEYAFRDPAPTRNPYNPEHTPGGSSSGSAAAVAAGMVPFTLGTQTAGSVNRPGCYCGISSFKPSYGSIDLTGVTPLAPSFDTLGILARWFADIQAIFPVLTENLGSTPNSKTHKMGVPDPRFFRTADEESKAHYADIVDSLCQSGWILEDIGMPFDHDRMNALHQHVMVAEMAEIFAKQVSLRPSAYKPLFRNAVEEGSQISVEAKRESLARIAEIRERVWREHADLDAILLLPVPTPAPNGLSSTGDQRFIAPWTALHGPMATIPTSLSKDRLPLSAMIVSKPGTDSALIAHAVALQKKIDKLPEIAPLYRTA